MAATKKTTAPRISIAELGKYLQSDALKRREIVRDQKEPKAFKVAYYDDARKAIGAYLTGEHLDLSVLEGVLEKLETKLPKATTEWEAQRIRGNIDAIETFADIELPAEFHSGVRVRGALHKSKLALGGLEVSVQPEVVLTRVVQGGQPSVGATHVYLSTTAELTEDAALNVATLLHQYCEEQFVSTHSARRDDCILIDVFARTTWLAPKSWKMRRKRVTAACEEIAIRWSAL